MVDFFSNLNYIYQALLAGLFTWFITLLGALLVYFFKTVNNNIMDMMLSLAAGVMIAASFFSLLLPSIELANEVNSIKWLYPALGFVMGGLLLFYFDKIFEHKLDHNMHHNALLIFSITLHNIPEGMAIGIAFGSLKYGMTTTLVSALMLALGIGIQNFPEGAAVSLPLKRNGLSTHKAFFLGQLSGFVEPIFAVLGALLALRIKIILPFILALAAGAMIYVVVAELIPDSASNKKSSIFILFGFVIMMILDVAFS